MVFKKKFLFLGTEPIGWVLGKIYKPSGNNRNCGDNNPAKKPEVRKKISDSLKSSVKFKEYQERRKSANNKKENN